MDRRGLSADRLVHLRVQSEPRRHQRRHLIGSCGNHPGDGAAAAAFWTLIAEPILCKLATAAANISGCVVTNDMNFLLCIQ